MRYFLLLVCLAVGTVAQAYNEKVLSIAYNPSRMGAYNYLKVNKELTLKGGLRDYGNGAEINLYGGIFINDEHASSHSNVSDPSTLNTINHIKPLGNYITITADNGDRTLCTKRPSTSGSGWDKGKWVYNQNACYGNTVTFNFEKLMGMKNDYNTPYMGGSGASALSDTHLIPNVYVYGSDNAITATSNYSKIKTIKQMYIKNPTATNPTLEVEALDASNKITLKTVTLFPKYEASSLRIQDYIFFGPVKLRLGETGAFASCKNRTLLWKERKTIDNKKVKILACRKN